VVGIDDLPWASMAKPALATIRVPLKRIGEAAAELLLEPLPPSRRTPPAEPESRLLEGELVVRESTAQPAAVLQGNTR
jgi:LacI family transcriptional regulator